MSLKRRLKRSSNVEVNILKDGAEYEARLVYVADLGVQLNSYRGEEKDPVQKIALGFEILGESVSIDGEESARYMFGKPFNVYYSLTKKGSELAYYKIFNPQAEAGEVADWDAVLGTPCSVLIGYTKSKDGSTTYDNIQSISSIPKKYHKGVEEGKLSTAVGDSDDPDNEVTRRLYGLAKWTYDQRITEENSGEQDPDHGGLDPDDEIPF